MSWFAFGKSKFEEDEDVWRGKALRFLVKEVVNLRKELEKAMVDITALNTAIADLKVAEADNAAALQGLVAKLQAEIAAANPQGIADAVTAIAAITTSLSNTTALAKSA